ncbi:MAG: integrase [Flavobacteriaceae bacterium]|nr:MAG: integrase [Flavobacteriaceae bacterium]
MITFEYRIAYDSAYSLTQKPLFSNPKIYSGKGDLSKRWYVYFYYRNEETGRLKLATPIYGVANKYKTKEERMSVLLMYRETLLKLLKQGYNPFVDNRELHQKLTSKGTGLTPAPIQKKEETSMPLQEAFDFGLQLKEKIVSERTIRDYKNKIDNFLKWFYKKHPTLTCIHQIDKKNVTEFLNTVLTKTSARNRNNYRTELSSILQVLEDNDIIAANFIKKIPVLKSIPQKHKTYTQKEQVAIFEFLETKDPILLLYIKFISYGFMRPIEVCRLKVKDINLTDKTIQFKAKNGLLKTKMIPKILWNDLLELGELKKESVLFTPNELGAKWDTAIDNRRDYFSKRFKKVVKDNFNLGTDYGLYSFRHTYITKLYRALREKSSPFETKSKLMLITGHTTMSALEKYLRDIDAELPEDYSEML